MGSSYPARRTGVLRSGVPAETPAIMQRTPMTAPSVTYYQKRTFDSTTEKSRALAGPCVELLSYVGLLDRGMLM